MNTDNSTTTSAKPMVDSALGPAGSVRDAAWSRVTPVFAIAGVTKEAADDVVTHIGDRLTQEDIPHEVGELLTEGLRRQLTGSVVTLDPEDPSIAVERVVHAMRSARRDAHCIFVVLPGEQGASLARRELPFLVEGDNLVTVDPSSTKA